MDEGKRLKAICLNGFGGKATHCFVDKVKANRDPFFILLFRHDLYVCHEVMLSGCLVKKNDFCTIISFSCTFCPFLSIDLLLIYLLM